MKEKKSSYTVKFPIATAMNTDKYYIERIEVLDYSGNSRLYTAYGLEYPYLVEGNTTYMVDQYDSLKKAAFGKHWPVPASVPVSVINLLLAMDA